MSAYPGRHFSWSRTMAALHCSDLPLFPLPLPIFNLSLGPAPGTRSVALGPYVQYSVSQACGVPAPLLPIARVSCTHRHEPWPTGNGQTKRRSLPVDPNALSLVHKSDKPFQELAFFAPLLRCPPSTSRCWSGQKHGSATKLLSRPKGMKKHRDSGLSKAKPRGERPKQESRAEWWWGGRVGWLFR